MNITKYIRRNFKNFLFAAQECQNWREVALSIFTAKSPKTLILKNGIRIDAPEHTDIFPIAREIFVEKAYNPDYLPIEKNDVVVDVGANIGLFTLFAASRTQNKVYSFEPFPENFEFLGRNIRANNLRNVIARAEAVCDKTGTARLFLNKTGGRHLLFAGDGKRTLEQYVEVPTTTLQQIMDDNNLKRIDFLKLDCEGSEGLILQTTPTDYLRKIRKIAMEFHDDLSPLHHNEIEKLLINAGFVTKLNWNGRSRTGYLYGFIG
jgi:FkbM family methyltransferase